MKKRYFGYVVVCEGCCVDLKYDEGGEDWKTCSEKVSASPPQFATAKAALEAGLKVAKRKRAGWKACKTKWGASWTEAGEDLAKLTPNTFRVFTYEVLGE
jgi:hypothetical protein